VPAPTGVTATQLQSGEVQVSWVFDPNEPVDGFAIREAGSTSSLATVSAGVRQASVTVPPGPHRFTVTATRTGSDPSTSLPSAILTTANRPDAPLKLSGKVVGSEGSNDATITVTWGAAPSNGSAILDYTLQAKDDFGAHTVTVTATTASYTVTCSAAYCDPGAVSVSVTARNARGVGPAATDTLTYSGPTPPALPSGGQQLVASDSTEWSGTSVEGTGTTTLTMSSPADWASFGGTCTWTHSGNQAGAASGSFPCGAASVQIPINNGYISDPNPGTVQHSVVFHATNGQGSVDSAQYAWTTTQTTLCAGCAAP
jgi:hypothetical protein